MELIDLLYLCQRANVEKCHVVIRYVRTGHSKTFINNTIHLLDLFNEYSVECCLVVKYKYDTKKNISFIECVC